RSVAGLQNRHGLAIHRPGLFESIIFGIAS
ncbi:MAG: hypothetical protein ACI814_001808, partial [Mariniblastus sp.]